MLNQPPENLGTRNLSWGRKTLYLIILTGIIFGIHTSASVNIQNSFSIPFAFSAVFSIFAYPFLIKNINFSNNIPLTSYLFLTLIVNLLAFNQIYLEEYILGPLQLLYSIFIALAVYLLVRELNLIALQRWCLGLTALIAALSVLELNGTISLAFTSVTQALTANVNLADTFAVSDIRDIDMHGTVRSKVLATEPSHAALTLMSLGFGFFWTKPRVQLIALWVVLILICIWTIRSPIIAATLVLCPVFIFLINQNQKLILRTIIGITPLLIFIYFLSDYLLAMFGTRIDTGGTRDGSFDMRFTVPFQFIRDFLPNHILFGVGVVGDFDMLMYDILAAYYERGMVYIDYATAGASISNNLAQHFISFGLVFGAITLVALAFMARMRSVLVWTIVCLECLMIWMFLGGYVAARVWVLCALVLAVARRSEYEDLIGLK